MDPELFSADLLGVTSSSPKAVGITIETESGLRWSDIIITGLRVVSLTASEAETSGATQSSDFDVEIYDRDKGTWTSPSEAGLVIRAESNNKILLVSNLEQPYKEARSDNKVWVRISQASGTSDYTIDIWCRPRELYPNPTTERQYQSLFRGI